MINLVATNLRDKTYADKLLHIQKVVCSERYISKNYLAHKKKLVYRSLHWLYIVAASPRSWGSRSRWWSGTCSVGWTAPCSWPTWGVCTPAVVTQTTSSALTTDRGLSWPWKTSSLRCVLLELRSILGSFLH